MIKKALQISLLGLLGSFFGFFCQILTAKYFGATSSYDLFVVASTYPLFVTGLITTSLNHYLIPEILKKTRKNSRNKFCFSIFLSFLFLSLFIACAGYLVSPFQMSYFGASSSNEFIKIAQIYWLATSLIPIISLFQSINIVGNNVNYVGKANLIPVLTTLFLFVIFRDNFGLTLLAYSLLIGNIISLLYLVKFSINPINIYKLTISDYKSLKEFYKKIPLIILSILCYVVFQSSDVYWCKFLSASSLSYVSYSQRFLVAFTTLNISWPIQVFLPHLSNNINSGKKNIAMRNIIKIFRISATLLIFQCIFFYFYSDNIISILLERGLFDSLATKNVSGLLEVSIFSSIFFSGSVVLLRYLFAEGNYKSTAASGLFITIIYFGLSGMLTKYFGLMGLSIAFVLSWCLFFIKLLLDVFKGQWQLIVNTENYFFLKNLSICTLIYIAFSFILRHFYIILFKQDLFTFIDLAVIFSITFIFFIFLTIKVSPIFEIKEFFGKFSKNA